MPILVAGKLKEDTIRKIVTGVKVSESALRNRIAAVLVEMARNDLEDISTLVDLSTKEGVDPKSVVDSYRAKAVGYIYQPAD